MFNNTTIFINETTLSFATSGQIWTFLPIFSLVILLAAILTNGTILYLFAKHTHLRTAFTVYLINLLGANLFSMLIQVPIYLVAGLRPYWWIGRPACTAYIYGYFIQAGMCNSHALISINRLWAVTRPISYRRLHTKRTAWLFCGIMWIYVHVLTLPGFVADILYYRLPEETYGCFLNKGPQPGWAFTDQFVVFSLPLLVMVTTYPVICYQNWKRKGVMGNSVAPSVRTTKVEVESMPMAVIEMKVTNKDFHREFSQRQPVEGRLRGSRKPKSNAFLVLTFVTFGMLVFWLPSVVFYTAIMFQNVDWGVFQEVATVLWFLEAVVDPVLFTLALSDLRNAVTKLFRFE